MSSPSKSLKNKLKNKFSKAKAFFGQKEWHKPILKADERNQYHHKIIHMGDDMVNGMQLLSDKWESELGRYYPANAFSSSAGHNFLRPNEIELKPGTRTFYTANARGTVGRYRRKAKLPPIHALDRIQQAERLQTLRDQNYTLDLKEYQALLANPATNQQAVEELRFLKALFEDAQKLNSAALEARLEKVQFASKGLGLLGMALGAAAGVTGLQNIAAKAANVAQSSAEQSLRLAESVGDKLGKVEKAAFALTAIPVLGAVQTKLDLNRQKMINYNKQSFKTSFETIKDVALKTASLVVIGAAANLTIPGATITALAIVTTAAKGALNVYGQQLEKKEMAIQMSKDELLRSIDEMIKNNGTIFFKEDNPMFQKAVLVKEQVDNLLDSYPEEKVMEAIGNLEGEASASAAAILDDMMTNAANPKPFTNTSKMNATALEQYKKKRQELAQLYKVNNANLDFELEVQKLKKLEKKSNANLQILRDRRAKLKRMYNTYKKPKLNSDLKNMSHNTSTATPQIQTRKALRR